MNQDKSDTVYDIIIIGGGITGAGILRESVKSGLKCLLLEKNDFASGTSSKSSKLIHGGLRYLQFAQFKLVRESLVERKQLLEEYPHIVKLESFYLPIYESKLKYKLGLMLYDFLSRGYETLRHYFLTKQEFVSEYPFVNQSNLKGSFVYSDCVTDDARLVNDVLLEATELGGEAHNYEKVLSVTENGMCFVKTTESIYQSKYVINATGIWSNDLIKSDVKLAPTKGVHLLFTSDKIPAESPMFFPSMQNDNRMIFVIPWKGMTMIGTTDTDYTDSYEKVDVSQTDIEYLLLSINKFFPKLSIIKNDIKGSFAGLRPLLQSGNSANSRSRDYELWWNTDKVLSICGGKLTGFLSMARACLDILPFDKNVTMNYQRQIPQNRFTNDYHMFAELVEEIWYENHNFRKVIFENITIAEVIFFVRYQSVKKLSDLLTRRLSISYKLAKLDNREEVIWLFGNAIKHEKQLSHHELDEQVRDYIKELDDQFIYHL